MSKPLFSVIVVFYQGTQTDEELKRCMDSLEKQGDGLYETLLYHDGPLQRKCNYPITVTEKRFNDWGHSLRDIGIRKAQGNYIVHLNADNLLYPNVLDKLADEIDKNGEKNIYILPVKLVGTRVIEDRGDTFRVTRTGNPGDSIVVKGTPKPGAIDAMQLVMKTQLWRDYGGWYDKSKNSDGTMYERFCKDHEPHFVDITIGEHH